MSFLLITQSLQLARRVVVQISPHSTNPQPLNRISSQYNEKSNSWVWKLRQLKYSTVTSQQAIL